MKIPEKMKVLYKEYIVEETANLHDEAGDCTDRFIIYRRRFY